MQETKEQHVEAIDDNYTTKLDLILQHVTTMQQQQHVGQEQFRALEQKVDSIHKNFIHLKSLIPDHIINPGNPLTAVKMLSLFLQNPLLHKIFYVLKFCVNTKQGVIPMWPFRINRDFYFIINTRLLLFISEQCFPKFLSQTDKAQIHHHSDKNVLFRKLTECGFECCNFAKLNCENPSYHEINMNLHLFPRVFAKTFPYHEFIGISANQLKVIFSALGDGNPLQDKNIPKGLVQIKKSDFPQWKLRSTHKIFGPNDIKQPAVPVVFKKRGAKKITADDKKGLDYMKLRWGIEVPYSFFSESFYEALVVLDTIEFQNKNYYNHIGPGWVKIEGDEGDCLLEHYIENQEHQIRPKPVPILVPKSKSKRPITQPKIGRKSKSRKITDSQINLDSVSINDSDPVPINDSDPVPINDSDPVFINDSDPVPINDSDPVPIINSLLQSNLQPQIVDLSQIHPHQLGSQIQPPSIRFLDTTAVH